MTWSTTSARPYIVATNSLTEQRNAMILKKFMNRELAKAMLLTTSDPPLPPLFPPSDPPLPPLRSSSAPPLIPL